jgi:hypothetical protein
VHAAPDNYRRIDAPTDLVHLFATPATALWQALAAARRNMRMDAVIWVSWVRALALPLKLVLRVSERRP